MDRRRVCSRVKFSSGCGWEPLSRMMASYSSTAIDRKSLTVQSKGGFPADGSLLDRYVFHVVRWPTIDCIGRHCPWTLGVQFKPLPPPFRIPRVVPLRLFPLVSHPSLHHSVLVGGGDLPLSLLLLRGLRSRGENLLSRVGCPFPWDSFGWWNEVRPGFRWDEPIGWIEAPTRASTRRGRSNV